MSKVDETWASIQEFLQLYKDVDSLPHPERGLRWMKIAVGMRKLQEDMDYFLENTPPGDMRRDVCLDLKEMIAKAKGS